jgi:uncharacterized protein (DUF2126 family)
MIAAGSMNPGISDQSYADERPGSTSVQVVCTALSVEPREGRLYVFLPPLAYLEHYLDLVASVEATAEELSMPVLLEGYEPPRDLRMERLQLTPDPGVLEVNIHPSRHWAELVEVTTALYEEARLSRPGTEKFMLTAGTPVQAVATTSPSVVPRPPTARSSGGRICCRAL